MASSGQQSSCKGFLGFFSKLSFYLGWICIGKMGGGGAAVLARCRPWLSRGIWAFFCVESRGVREAGARPPSSSPGFPRSPRPALQPGRLGPRPALLPQPPAGRAETRARGGGTRGGWGSGAAPTLEANWVMDGEGGARGEEGRAGRPRPRWTEPPGSLLPPAERGCPFSAA